MKNLNIGLQYGDDDGLTLIVVTKRDAMWYKKKQIKQRINGDPELLQNVWVNNLDIKQLNC
jgi:hypothetical protein